METAYSILTSLSERDLSQLQVKLDEHTIYHKKKLIFRDGKFCNMKNAEMLNELPLISEDADWISTLQQLYEDFSRSYPRRSRYQNFLHKSTYEEDYLMAPDNYHATRVALDLYIVFHHYLADIKWPDSSKFMLAITKEFKIKKQWLM